MNKMKNLKICITIVCFMLMSMMLMSCVPKDISDSEDIQNDITKDSSELTTESNSSIFDEAGITEDGITEDVSKDEETKLLYQPIDENHPLYGLEVGPIEDVESLNYLLNNYFYDSITTLRNYGTFSQTEEIYPYYVAEFASRRYMKENGISHLEGDGYVFIPMEDIMPYVDQYFDLQSLDLSELDSFYYDPSKDEVHVNATNYDMVYDYTMVNSWSMDFGNVYMHENGSITGDLITYFYGNDQEVEDIYTITLLPRMDQSGDYYFESASFEYFTLGDVNIEGTYESLDLFDEYKDERGYFQAEMNYIGEFEDVIFLNIHSYGFDGENKIVSLDKDTLTIVNEEIYENLNESVTDYSSIEIKRVDGYGDVLVVTGSDNVYLYDEKFMLIRTIEVPFVIREQMTQNTYGNDILEDGFLGYDIDSTLTEFVYSTEEGLYIYDSKTETNRLLQEKVKGNDKFSEYNYFYSVKYVGENNNIIAFISGWEWRSGYAFYNRSTDTLDLVEYISDYDPIMVYKNELWLFVLEYGEMAENGEYISEPYLLNLETGAKETVPEVYRSIHYQRMYDDLKVGYIFSDDGNVVTEKSDDFMDTTFTYLTQEGIYLEESMTIYDANIEVLVSFKDTSGKIHVFIYYNTNGGNYDIIDWHLD